MMMMTEVGAPARQTADTASLVDILITILLTIGFYLNQGPGGDKTSGDRRINPDQTRKDEIFV